MRGFLLTNFPQNMKVKYFNGTIEFDIFKLCYFCCVGLVFLINQWIYSTSACWLFRFEQFFQQKNAVKCFKIAIKLEVLQG